MPFVTREDGHCQSFVCRGTMTPRHITRWFDEGFSCFLRYPGVTLGDTVVCCHDGCEQKFKLRNEWLPHILDCDKRPRVAVTCRYCAEEVSQGGAETHLLAECTELPCLVYLCEHAGTWREMEHHIIQHRFEMFVMAPYRARMLSLVARLATCMAHGTLPECKTILADIAMETEFANRCALDPVPAAREGAQGIDYHLDGFQTESSGDEEPSE